MCRPEILFLFFWVDGIAGFGDFVFLGFFKKWTNSSMCKIAYFQTRFSRTLLVHFVINDWNPNGPQMCFHRPCLCLDNNFINRYLKFLSSCSLLLLLLLGPPGSITSTSLCLLWTVLCIEFLFDKNFVVFSQLKFLKS